MSSTFDLIKFHSLPRKRHPYLEFFNFVESNRLKISFKGKYRKSVEFSNDYEVEFIDDNLIILTDRVIKIFIPYSMEGFQDIFAIKMVDDFENEYKTKTHFFIYGSRTLFITDSRNVVYYTDSKINLYKPKFSLLKKLFHEFTLINSTEFREMKFPKNISFCGPIITNCNKFYNFITKKSFSFEKSIFAKLVPYIDESHIYFECVQNGEHFTHFK